MLMKIALAGNPNSGKTTLFNALTGSNQFVGNWPGVTVEKKEGRLKGRKDVVITDLPGIYSLSPYTLEEVVARNYLLRERPDAILNIVDGTNLERNLYLSTQLMELGIPVVMAVNMMDVVRKNGDTIHIKQLAKDLGCEVVEISALRNEGIDAATGKAVKAAQSERNQSEAHRFDDRTERALAEIAEKLGGLMLPEGQRRFYAIKLLERDEKIMEELLEKSRAEEAAEDVAQKSPQIEAIISALEAELDDDAESIITGGRYDYIASIIDGCCSRKGRGKMTASDKIDRIVTNRWLALPVFALIMWFVYYVSVTTVGTFVTDWTNDVLFGEIVPGAVEGLLVSIGCAPWLQSLILDGIIAGVGAVLGFVPQMLVLFAFLAFLEACGYMARIAFIMDRIFRRFGLSGKSFIPILIGTGCGVPGIMASRTIESDRDRRMTILTTTFIPCSAKLPIIALIAGALFDGASWVAPSAYFVGIAAIVCSGILLKKTKLFAGDPAPFVMELPAYHMPTLSNIWRSMWERGSSFIKKAGTVILLSTVVLWFLQGFGWVDGSFRLLETEGLNHSILAGLGRFIAPVFVPLGWGDWRMAVAAVTGLIAKENVVGTFGVLFGFAEVAENGKQIWGTLAGSMTAASAYSFLIFNLLCAPCFAAIGAIRREMNSAKWTWFAIGYQTGLAYLVSLVIYQAGTLLTGGGNGTERIAGGGIGAASASAGSMGIGTLAAGALVLAAVILAARTIRKDRKAGNYCGGDCGHCGGACRGRDHFSG